MTSPDSPDTARRPAAPDFHTLIIGAGFSGIGAGIELDKAGLGDYLIVEAGEEPGGTWYWNTYPGIAVDIPSFSYQFSFEQSADWSRTYAPGRELKAYADRCVAKYGLRHKIRFNTKVTGAVFDDDTALWRLDLGDGEALTARFLINASGVLTVPKPPDIDGVGQLRRRHDAHRPLGPRSGPHRQASGHHRHRRIRGAGDSRARPNRAAAHRLSAHADLVLPEVRRAVARTHALGHAHPRRQGRPALAQPGLRRVDVPDLRAVRDGVPARQARRAARPGLSQARGPRPGGARRSSLPVTPSAASGRASTTRTCRRTTATTSNSSPSPSTRSPGPAWPPPTGPPATSTCSSWPPGSR